MSSFNQTVMNLRLHNKLPMNELKDVASAYVTRGMAPEAAFQKAVEDRLTLNQMEERRIVQTVRGAYENHGGKPRPVAPAAQPEPVEPAAETPAAEQPQPIAQEASDAPAASTPPEPVRSTDAQPTAAADPDQPGAGAVPAAGMAAEQPAALIPAPTGMRPKTEKEARALRQKMKADKPRTEREAKARRAQVRTG